MSENKSLGNDDRLKKSAGASTRADRDESDVTRTSQDGTILSREERRRMLRAEWQQEILPTPPKVDGWHYCWLSTTNSADPIYKRVQRGYQPVKASEIAGFAQYQVQQGEFEGCVACNEMVLFKIPQELYLDLMSYFHHELPLEEEDILKANVKQAVEGQDSDGRDLGQMEGYQSLGHGRKPIFS